MPLDVEDGAARVLDPIFQGLVEEDTLQYGQLFNNYLPVEW